MATETEENYGKQIIWKNENEFSGILMHPRNGEKMVEKLEISTQLDIIWKCKFL